MKAPLPAIHDLPKALQLVEHIMSVLIERGETASVQLSFKDEEFFITIKEE